MILDNDQRKAVEDQSRYVAILASAGSGKTRTLVARIVNSIRMDGLEPSRVVAFTFTERAGDELRSRVFQELKELGSDLSKMFVGTIHSFCYRYLLSNERFFGFEPLDEINLESLVYRLYDTLGLDEVYGMSFGKNIERFLKDYELYENELLSVEEIPSFLREAITKFNAILINNRLLSFGGMIRYATELISERKAEVDHVFVDEFQDINPAQLMLIKGLIGDSAKLTVVGDDLQSIYQWRGSDVSLLLNLTDSFSDVSFHVLGTNYRSTPQIVGMAEAFAETIKPKLDKSMVPYKTKRYEDRRINAFFEASSENDQSILVGKLILMLKEQGFRFRDIAILLRSAKTSAPTILRSLRQMDIPFFSPQVNLDGTIITEVFVPLFMLLSNIEEPRSKEEESMRDTLTQTLGRGLKNLLQSNLAEVSDYLEQWRLDMRNNKPQVYNVRSYLYHFLERIGLYLTGEELDLLPQIGTLTQIVRSVEEIHRRTIRGQPKKTTASNVYKQIAYMFSSRKDDFGETNMMMASADAVIVTTVHQAKGLEWPVVILPSLVSRRFPVRTRRHETSFSDEIAERYGTSEVDERRLFYVAMTRAKNSLFMLGFKTKGTRMSKFIGDLLGTRHLQYAEPLKVLSQFEFTQEEEPTKTRSLIIDLSSLLLYLECPLQYHLRRNSGIYPPIQDELGFGRSLHEIIQRRSTEPSTDLEQLVHRYTHIPYESGMRLVVHKEAIKRRVERMASLGLLKGQVQSEVDIALIVRNVTITGKIDCLVKDDSGLKILEWKSSIGEQFLRRYVSQIRFYALSLKQAAIPISSASLIDVAATYKMESLRMVEIDVSERKLREFKENLEGDLRRLTDFLFIPRASPETCLACDVSMICSYAIQPQR